jgi:MinD-like ATPase involved in chromosome partitioning or flagellar assembly
VATVLSAREWEPALVAHARDTATVKIVLRAFQPRDIEKNAGDIDVVVAGGDVTWVTPHQLSEWRRLGLAVVGVHPPEDAPAASLLEVGGAAEVVPDTIATAALVQAIRFVAPKGEQPAAINRGQTTAVVGARGAPGATEIACGIACVVSQHHSTLLVDGDLAAPSIAIRLGVAPRPDLADAADSVRAEGLIDSAAIRKLTTFHVIPGSHREGELPIRDHMLAGVVAAAAVQYEIVVLDSGSYPMSEAVLDVIDRVVLVVDASPIGIVRAAQLTSSWFGPTPDVIVNRATSSNRTETIHAVRRWTGLDPVAVIPLKDRVRRDASAGRTPHRSVRRSLSGFGGPQ